MHSFNRGRGFQNRTNNNRGRNNFAGFGGRGNRGGRRQATFDPTPVIIQAGLQQAETARNPIKAEVFQPVHQFSDFAISDQLKANIAKRGYAAPTPIQDQIIPHVLEGRDVVGIANTGTGKTAAFLVPLIEKVLKNPEEKVLIIVPTRELALQVRDELMSFSPGMQVFSSLCIGGAPIYRQIESLRRGQHFVIGTPGRIKDLNERRKIRFEQFTNIVLDEVDRMLDMGFVNEIRDIIRVLPNNRQSLFFSATMTPRVKEIMQGFLNDPVMVSVKTQDTTSQVTQELIKLKGKSKVDVLHDLLNTEGFAKVLVFGRTKHGAEKLSKELRFRGFRVDAIHGNKSQGQRQRALRDFKDNYIQALIATDVVSRGVDIADVTHVINYDLPESYEDYIHRIGRTGRADKVGVALTFVD
ncbi:MAG: DEAD/DEAH box helicase [Candidatus Pacebacteria bacterium]|nr:DEAD/DEAH box helicase [Candidatus Paceibacterota bacterium]